ncbi:NUDIX domain-containing protein [Janibacter cremeus]|uniref:ADP-ribose pyrophosphatase n=1 Tax=Janibacter cremeus TaxID=1285192 RepID=A0A852W0L3_9MICO|nr:NUDIX hydrolase [Janibacter cremeus]NYF99525.1 ADP-ribose pyrophosphatase [Janibacter cremeus]
MTSEHPPLRDEIVPSPVVDSEIVFDGVVWDVRREAFDLEGERLVREVIDHPGAVAVLALDEQDRTLLIRQYRHPISSHEWEIPAGLLDVAGEDPLLAAQRELAEEADLVAEHWAVLVDYFSSPGGMNEALRIYLARDLSEVPAAERHEREGEEAHILHRRVPLDEVVDAVLAGDVHNSTLVIGVLAAQRMRDHGWTSLRPADSPWPQHPSNRNHA